METSWSRTAPTPGKRRIALVATLGVSSGLLGVAVYYFARGNWIG